MGLADFASGIVRDAGTLALQFFASRDSLAIEHKGRLDLVTRADREVEQALSTAIKRRYPDDAVYGEEGSREAASNGRTWVIDPIDGTMNFLHGNDAWGISVGVLENGRPEVGVVYAPALQQLILGGRDRPAQLNGAELPLADESTADDAVIGIGFGANVEANDQTSLVRFIVSDGGMTFRRNGSSSVTLMMLMKREIDGFMGVGVSSWDIAGGIIAAETLGYRSSLDWTTGNLGSGLSVSCASRALLEWLREFRPSAR